MATGIINHFTTNSAKDPSWFVVFTWKKYFSELDGWVKYLGTRLYVIGMFVSLCIKIINPGKSVFGCLSRSRFKYLLSCRRNVNLALKQRAVIIKVTSKAMKCEPTRALHDTAPRHAIHRPDTAVLYRTVRSDNTQLTSISSNRVFTMNKLKVLYKSRNNSTRSITWTRQHVMLNSRGVTM